MSDIDPCFAHFGRNLIVGPGDHLASCDRIQHNFLTIPCKLVNTFCANLSETVVCFFFLFTIGKQTSVDSYIRIIPINIL